MVRTYPAYFIEGDILQFAGLAMLLTGVLQYTKRPPLYSAIIGIPFFVIAAAYTVIAYLNGYGMMACGDADFYKMSVTDAVACIGIAFGYVGLMRLVTRSFPNKLRFFVVKVSSRVNDIYIIHWIILEWVADAFLAWYLELTPGLFSVSLIGILVLAAAVPLSFVKNNVKNRLASKKTADR